jgi:hypothetical protein
MMIPKKTRFSLHAQAIFIGITYLPCTLIKDEVDRIALHGTVNPAHTLRGRAFSPIHSLNKAFGQVALQGMSNISARSIHSLKEAFASGKGPMAQNSGVLSFASFPMSI